VIPAEHSAREFHQFEHPEHFLSATVKKGDWGKLTQGGGGGGVGGWGVG